nr:unnamed protein product [Digitaria exilis]
MARSDEDEVRLAALLNIGGFLAFGAAFLLVGFIPAITPPYKALCWQTATVGFVAAAVTVWRHPGVWFPLVRCWYKSLGQKAKPAPGR